MGKKRSERIERPEQKAAREAAARGYEARQKRNQVLLWSGVVVAVLGAAAFAYRYYQQARLLDTVTTSTYSAGQHMAGPIKHVENPPVGGTHNVAWQNCGIYDEPKNQFPNFGLDPGNVLAVWPDYKLDPRQLERFKRMRNACMVGEATMRKFGWQVGEEITLRGTIFPVNLTLRIVGTIPEGAGNPLVVTVKLPGDPAIKVAEAELVIAGPSLTFSTKGCAASDRIPLVAVMVRG